MTSEATVTLYAAFYDAGGPWKIIGKWTEDREEAEQRRQDFITNYHENGLPLWDIPDTDIRSVEAQKG